MDKATFEEIKVCEQIKHVATDLSSHKRRHAASPVNRKGVAYTHELFRRTPIP